MTRFRHVVNCPCQMYTTMRQQTSRDERCSNVSNILILRCPILPCFFFFLFLFQFFLFFFSCEVVHQKSFIHNSGHKDCSAVSCSRCLTEGKKIFLCRHFHPRNGGSTKFINVGWVISSRTTGIAQRKIIPETISFITHGSRVFRKCEPLFAIRFRYVPFPVYGREQNDFNFNSPDSAVSRCRSLSIDSPLLSIPFFCLPAIHVSSFDHVKNYRLVYLDASWMVFKLPCCHGL